MTLADAYGAFVIVAIVITAVLSAECKFSTPIMQQLLLGCPHYP